jgi:hypothetical protein
VSVKHLQPAVQIDNLFNKHYYTTTQLANAGRTSQGTIALHIQTAERLSSLATELLNPFCSESSWTNLAASLGEMTHQPIIRRNRAQQTSDLDFDGMGAFQDDDDEGTAKPGKTKALDQIPLDFNLLSPHRHPSEGRVLVPADRYRSAKRPPGFYRSIGPVLSCWYLRRAKGAARCDHHSA